MIFCERNELQMGWAMDRIERWGNELKKFWLSDLVAPMQAMLVNKKDLCIYDPENPAEGDSMHVRYVPNPKMFDPVPQEALKDFERLYGGCKQLLVSITFLK